MSLSASIKALQNTMRKDAGIDGDAQRLGQLGWLLFYKIFSDLEQQTEIENPNYVSPIPERLQWETWADEQQAGIGNVPTGDELLNFIEDELFPSFENQDLTAFTGMARERAAILQSVFEGMNNYMKNGTLIRQVINRLNNDIDFNQAKTRHLFGDIYEQLLRDLQASGNSGEFYTPRAVTQFSIEMVDPQPGEIIFDPACGTGGFLTGSFEHVKDKIKTAKELKTLKDNIRGVEKKSLPHVLCVTNMMIQGIEVPSGIIHGNTLARPLRDYGPKDQVDVIVTNPPFGGTEEDGIENNFPAEFRTRETALLFLVLLIELLKDGGRAAVVLPDGTLFGDGIETRVKQRLVEECNLHTIIRLPKSVFAPYTSIKTNVLFLTKGEPTKETWYYEHPYPEGYKAYSKTKPMKLEEFEPEREWWNNRKETEQAWMVPIQDIIKSEYNLDIKNPNTPEETTRDPKTVLAEFTKVNKQKDKIEQEIIAIIKDAIANES